MNTNTVSDECNDGMCSACRYEDCACPCHRDLSYDVDDSEQWEYYEEAA